MADHKEDSTRIVRNTGALFFRLLVITLVGLYTSRVVLHVLGQDDFGVYNIVGTVVILLTFFRSALNNATYRFFTYDLGAGDPDRLKKTFSMSINVHLILAAGLFVVMEIIGPLIIAHLNIPTGRMAAAQVVFQISLVSFVLEVIKTPFNSCIIAHEKMGFYAVTSLVEVVLKLLLVFLLSTIHADKLILYALLMLGTTIIMFLWYVFYCRRSFPETHYQRGIWDKDLFKGMLSYSGWSLLVNAADVTVNQCLNIFMNLFGGVRANASMGVANQVNEKMVGVLGSFTQSFNPQIIKSYAQNDRPYFMSLIFSTSKLSFYLLFAFAFPLAVNLEFVLDVWLVETPQYAAIFLKLILCFSLVDAFSNPLFTAVHATGNLKVHQILMASIKIINIPLSYLLLKSGAPIYMPLAVYASLNLVCDVVRIIYLRTLIGLPVWEYVREVFGRMVIVLVLSCPAVLYLHPRFGDGWWQLFALTGIFLFVYIPAVLFVGLNGKERGLLTKMLPWRH